MVWKEKLWWKALTSFFEKARSIWSIQCSLRIQLSGKSVHMCVRTPAHPVVLTTAHLYPLCFLCMWNFPGIVHS